MGKRFLKICAGDETFILPVVLSHIVSWWLVESQGVKHDWHGQAWARARQSDTGFLDFGYKTDNAPTTTANIDIK